MRRPSSLLTLAVLLLGCQDPTEVKLSLSTDAKCADVIGTTITVGPLRELEQRPPVTETTRCAADGRIGSLVVVPRDAKDDEFALRVVTGFYKTPQQCVDDGFLGGCIVVRRALHFIPHEAIDLPILLEAACIDVPCEATQTCRQGKCVSATLTDPLHCTDPAGCESAGGAGGGGSDAAQAGAQATGGNDSNAGAAGDSASNTPQAGAGGSPGAGGAGSTAPEPVAHVLAVTTTDDTLDGDVGSIDALIAQPGEDREISLREAILACNNTPNTEQPDRIEFAIAGAAPHTIQVLASELPALDDAVIIDASTEPGYQGWPVVELLGTGLPSGSGISLVAGSDGSTLRGLAIGNFPDYGIRSDNSGGHRIRNNHLGVAANGTTRRANRAGLYLNQSGGNVVGGSILGPDAASNVCSGNSADGIVLTGSGTQNNVVNGNIVGLDAKGMAALPNHRHGILLSSGASFTTIGGATTDLRNVISANLANGIRLADGSHDCVIQNNLIGSDSAFSANDTLGNAWAGIRVIGSSNNLLGGVTPQLGNRIRFNLLAGIEISGLPTPFDNAVLGNEIGGNGGLGINLRSDGVVTANDPEDVDGGPNDGLNYPEPTSTSYALGQVSMAYSLDVPAGDYRIEFFISVAPNPSGYGNGEWRAHAETITHAGKGAQSFNAAFACAETDWLTTVSTFIKPTGGFGPSSEFSRAVPTTF